MLTTSTIVERIIRNKPFLAENLKSGLINYSALARQIRPEAERSLMKTITEAALIMSLKRLEKKISSKVLSGKFLKENPDMVVRSNLAEITFSNSDYLIKKFKELFEKVSIKKRYFLTITYGVFETTIITSQELKKKIKEVFINEKITSQFDNLSSITAKFSKEIVELPGVYAHILKTLAWEGINVIEVISTFTEFTIIFDDREFDRAFTILKNLFSK